MEREVYEEEEEVGRKKVFFSRGAETRPAQSFGHPRRVGGVGREVSVQHGAQFSWKTLGLPPL